ncbi:MULTISPECIES: FHA domain-containing protein [Actinomycetes]|uniref:FHA domain-containing protein n=1 Tax=Actinomycetes TaxID=1760 RepID=UPI0005B87C8D|nr:FHA domain-containing protein [Actinomyces polynesiensis]
MTAPLTLPESERVADWPRISATLRADGTGSITVNGTERPCVADNVTALRTGMIAHVALIAARLRRPVRLVVTEDTDTWALAVRPEGIVQLVDDDGTIPPATGLSVHEGPCRSCRHVQPVTATSCSQCGIERPHSVEAGPRETYQRRRGSTPTEHVPLPPRPRRAAKAATTPLPPLPPRRRRPTLTLTFDAQPSVTVTGGAAIGRNPASVGGRTPVAIASPGRLLSRTHVLVDVDEHGRIIVTDADSANGVELATTPAVQLTPGVPSVIAAGTTLLLGDVYCTVNLA